MKLNKISQNVKSTVWRSTCYCLAYLVAYNWNISTLDKTYFFENVQTYKLFPKYSSKNCVNLMGLLDLTVALMWKIICLPCFKSMNKISLPCALTASIHYKPNTNTNHIQLCQYGMYITRCLYWHCSWSWHINHICSCFIDRSNFCETAWIKVILESGEWGRSKFAWSCNHICDDGLPIIRCIPG